MHEITSIKDLFYSRDVNLKYLETLFNTINSNPRDPDKINGLKNLVDKVHLTKIPPDAFESLRSIWKYTSTSRRGRLQRD